MKRLIPLLLLAFLLVGVAIAYPTDDTHTKLLMHGNGTWIDEAGHSATNNSDSDISFKTKYFGTGSMSFPGTGSTAYATVASSSDYNFGAGDYTYDFWVNFTAWTAAGGSNYIIHQSNGLDIEYYNGNEHLNIYTPTVRGFVTGGLSLGTWYHIAFVKNNSVIHCYVNGAEIGTGIADTNSLGESELRISGYPGYNDGLNGFLDELRISNIARWTAAFTPPTGEYLPSGATMPVAAFHASPLVVWRNGTIQFTDDTTNSPLTWDWYDPNTANPFFSGNLTNQNPKVFPRTWGYHSVNLIACNGAGCSTKASGARYIYVLPPGVI